LSMASLEKNRRILVVDDNEAIHADFRKILAAEGPRPELNALRRAVFGRENPAPALRCYDLDFATQGRGGLELVRGAVAAGTPYALAFIDMRMPPGWDGLETIDHLWREDPRLQVVICTAYSDYSWEDIVKRFGYNDRLLLLKKPFDNAEVSQVACALTEKWQLAEQARRDMSNLEELVGRRTEELRQSNEHLQRQITEREGADQRLRHAAFHDALTGLPNRALLLDRLQHCLDRRQRDPSEQHAVLFLDLDNFKIINDSLGHIVGDKLLVGVADRLLQTVRSSDSVSRTKSELTIRLGGDEFVILLEDVKHPSDALTVAERIQRELSSPFHVADQDITVAASIGIAFSDEHTWTAEDLLRAADTAMYRAKSAGKARFAVFDHEMHAAVTRRLQLENDLRRALDQKQFVLVYQPIVHLATGRMNACEALLRWDHPEHGLISPVEFVPVAEETGLIVPLGEWVIDEACGQLCRWNEGREPADRLRININLSKKQLLHAHFSRDLEILLRHRGVDPAVVNLEITESLISESPRDVSLVLTQLQNLGVGLHMDDFGTGQSSLAALHEFPLHVLKLDQAFIQSMHKSARYVAVVQAVVQLAHNLDMQVVAEGIESHDQLARLIELGCDYGQGFLFSRPIPPDELTKRWQAQPRRQANAASS
jgi:diguanylate cyclase (GGDEF)-like protein